jgi:TRAP-type C4-dicarboxylate transport system permease small subunit
MKQRLADAALGILIFICLLILAWYGWIKEAVSW